MKVGSGVVIICVSTGRILLGKRKDSLSWANFGGTLEAFESTYQCAKREVYEETGLVEGVDFKITYNRAAHVKEAQFLTYYTYIGYTDSEIIPKINEEHVQFGWFERNLLPNNMHFGVMEAINSTAVHKALTKINKL